MNGAKSRGPKTPEGKRISSENAFKHGMAAKKIFVLSNESVQTFAECVQVFTETFKPCNDVELNFIVQAAAAQWRLRRVYMFETAALDLQMEKQAQELEKKFQHFDEAIRMFSAFEALANETRTLDLLQRYEGRLNREYERAIRNFERVRAERTQDDAGEDIPAAVHAEPVIVDEKVKRKNEPTEARPAEMQNEPKPGDIPTKISRLAELCAVQSTRNPDRPQNIEQVPQDDHGENIIYPMDDTVAA